MGNIFACIIRSQVNVLDIGSLSHNYVKRCASCGSRQYTSSNNCRFCGGQVYEVDAHTPDAAATSASSARAGAGGAGRRRRAAHNANVLSTQVNGAHASIPVILAHDPETDQIIRYVQDYRGQLVRISGPSPEGFRMRSDHPDYLLSNSGRMIRGDEDEQKEITVEKLREEVDSLPKTLDINMDQIADSIDELNTILASLAHYSHGSPDDGDRRCNLGGSTHSTSSLRLRSVGSGRITNEKGATVELAARVVDGGSGSGPSEHCNCRYNQQDLNHAIEHARQLLSCPVCLSEYNDCLTLPCGHSLCLLHIGDMATKKTSPSCPICREALPSALVTIGHVLKGTIEIAGCVDDKTTTGRTLDETPASSVLRGRGLETMDSQGRRVIVLPSVGSPDLSNYNCEACGGNMKALPNDIIEILRNEGLQENVTTFRRLTEKADGLSSKIKQNEIVVTASTSSNTIKFGRRQKKKNKNKTS